MDPNSIIARVMAQVGQQQAPAPAPQFSPAFEPIRRMLTPPFEAPRQVGANSMREQRGAYGPPGLDYDRSEAFARAQQTAQFLAAMAQRYGPPPAGVTNITQQMEYYSNVANGVGYRSGGGMREGPR